MKQGTVSSRVALLLRSAEVKPMFERFVQLHVELSLFLLSSSDFRAGSVESCTFQMDVSPRFMVPSLGHEGLEPSKCSYCFYFLLWNSTIGLGGGLEGQLSNLNGTTPTVCLKNVQ